MGAYDLNIDRGTTFSLSMTLNDSNSAPIDLTNYQVSGFLKYQYSDSNILANLNATKIDPFTSGLISLSISATGTFALPITIGKYDINIYDTSGNVTKVLYGNAYVNPQVTF